jgi:hypothetical protein
VCGYSGYLKNLIVLHLDTGAPRFLGEAEDRILEIVGV